MKLDHTLIPAIDKEESAKFFAKIMGLEYLGTRGKQSLVRSTTRSPYCSTKDERGVSTSRST